jgi:hypothetical protein
MTPRRHWAGKASRVRGARGRRQEKGGAKPRWLRASAYKGAMPAEDLPSPKPSSAAKRRYGTGSIFENATPGMANGTFGTGRSPVSSGRSARRAAATD